VEGTELLAHCGIRGGVGDDPSAVQLLNSADGSGRPVRLDEGDGLLDGFVKGGAGFPTCVKRIVRLLAAIELFLPELLVLSEAAGCTNGVEDGVFGPNNFQEGVPDEPLALELPRVVLCEDREKEEGFNGLITFCHG
jgi:hypothetical protein